MVTEEVLEQLWKEHQTRLAQDKRKFSNFMRSKIHNLRMPELLFKLFKKYFKVCKVDNSKIAVIKQLDSDYLKSLILENNISAIHIPNFCPANIAESLSKSALEEYTRWKLNGTINTDMFYAGGSIPIEVAGHSWEDFQRYFGERQDFMAKQRIMSAGFWPVDQLRLQLDEAWPFGACLGHYLNQKLRPAIMRVMDEKNNFNFSVPKFGFIHTDDFPTLKPARGTYSANIYLKIPELGGELYIWPINLNRIKGIFNYLSAKILTMVITQDYVFDTTWQQEIVKLLPEPQVIKPQIGDLVIFHSGRPHSVAPVNKGIRITNQLFIYAKGASSSLMVGS